MMLNDPILYGATLPYGDLPIPSHVPPFPLQYPQFTPQFVPPFPPQFTTPWQDVTKYVPQNFGFSPYQQFPMLQQPSPITPWLQRPVTPFSQPFPITQPFTPPFTPPFSQPFTPPFNLNMPFCNWQRPFGW